MKSRIIILSVLLGVLLGAAATVLFWRSSSTPRLTGYTISSGPFPSTHLFLQSDGSSRPGIVLLHGSEGGSARFMWPDAMKLAERGFNVTIFCWYDCARSPATQPASLIRDIDVSQVVAGIDWFKNSEHVGTSHELGLYGFSRRAQLGLLIASQPKSIPFRLSSVVLLSGTDKVSPPFSPN